MFNYRNMLSDYRASCSRRVRSVKPKPLPAKAHVNVPDYYNAMESKCTPMLVNIMICNFLTCSKFLAQFNLKHSLKWVKKIFWQILYSRHPKNWPTKYLQPQKSRQFSVKILNIGYSTVTCKVLLNWPQPEVEKHDEIERLWAHMHTYFHALGE